MFFQLSQGVHRQHVIELLRLSELAKAEGAVIVLFTDQWGSPVSRTADHVVNALVEAPSSWDSTLAINLISEALIAEVQARRSDEAIARIERLEAMFQTTRIFRKST